MRADDADLPYIDEHAVAVAVPRDVVWTALERKFDTSRPGTARRRLGAALGSKPRSSFAVSSASWDAG